MPEPLLFARSLKLLAEVALLAWLGQSVLGALLGAGRERNAVYGLFRVLTAPIRWVRDRTWPAAWPERRRAALTACMLVGLWGGAVAWKVSLCLGNTLCR